MLTFSNTRYRRTSCNSASALVANRYGFCTSPANAAGAHSSTPEAFRRDAVSRPAPIAAPPSTSTVCARCAMDVATATAYDRLSLRRGLSLANPLESPLPRQASSCKAPVLLPMRVGRRHRISSLFTSLRRVHKEKKDCSSQLQSFHLSLVPKEGLEPSRDFSHYPLKIACLPIPPPRHCYNTNWPWEPPLPGLQAAQQVPQARRTSAGRLLRTSRR